MLTEKEILADKRIILVDENDNVVGFGEKMQVHKEGKLHRCFSIVVFNQKGELLLQKRAEGKYHCGNLWSNTCCGHPYAKEETDKSAHRRLQEEMGFDCPLKEVTVFHYRAEFDNGLTENEIDHLFVGQYNGDIKPDPQEVGDIKWITLENLKKDIAQNPSAYTPWFKIIINEHANSLGKA